MDVYFLRIFSEIDISNFSRKVWQRNQKHEKKKDAKGEVL